MAPEILQWLLETKLIEPEMFGYCMTEYGEQCMRETEAERAQLKNDQSNTIGIFKRDRYHSDDDMTLHKRKPLDPTPTKAKPQTKYK